MAGTAAAGELNTATRTRFAVATPADDAAIRRLLRENPIAGAIRLTFEREPNYFRSAELAGGRDQTIVVSSDSRLLCLGRCLRRECWVDDRACSTGYLAELRLDFSARGRFSLLRDGYRFFHALQKENPADLYFTTIVSDNERARRLLERSVPGLPSYQFLAELSTLLVAVPRRAPAARLRVQTGTAEHIPAIVRLLNHHGQQCQLATVWDAEKLLSLAGHGLPLDRFLLVLEGDELIACGALWDQRSFRQTVIHGYTPALAMARPLVNILRRLGGSPSLPRPGTALSHAYLSPLAFASGAGHLLPEFVAACFPLAAKFGLQFLTLALPSNDARLVGLRRRFRTRVWPSRLYRVAWPDQPSPLALHSERPFLPDLALL
jgi:hypothetical protein